MWFNSTISWGFPGSASGKKKTKQTRLPMQEV